MIVSRQCTWTAVVFLFIFHLSFHPLQAKSIDKDSVVTINIIPYDHSDEISTKQPQVTEYLKNSIARTNLLVLSDKPRFELLLKTRDIPESNEMIIVTLTVQPIPQNVVELAAKNEMFYSNIQTKQDKPKDGKFIREYVTSWWMNDFKKVINFEIYKIPEAEIENTCKKIINDFIERYNFSKSGK